MRIDDSRNDRRSGDSVRRGERARRDQERDQQQRRGAAMRSDESLTSVLVAVMAAVMLVLFMAWFFATPPTRSVQDAGGQRSAVIGTQSGGAVTSPVDAGTGLGALRGS